MYTSRLTMGPVMGPKLGWFENKNVIYVRKNNVIQYVWESREPKNS